MTGQIIHVGHECEPPPVPAHPRGTIWQCDCRRCWRNTGASWQYLSPIAIGLMQACGQLARELSRAPREDS